MSLDVWLAEPFKSYFKNTVHSSDCTIKHGNKMSGTRTLAKPKGNTMYSFSLAILLH